MKKLLFLSFAIFLSEITMAQPTEVTIASSQTKTFTSAIQEGQQYVLQIYLPSGYDKSNKKYPVVYLMDSQWDFPLLTALYGQQYYDGFVPDVIIVGITWGGIHPNPDSLRVRDYTPTKDNSSPQSGGAHQFLSVIKNEVFPIVEKDYRVDSSDRTLVGCSLGGLFTLYTLFTHPHMFNRYIAASPAFLWDNGVLYKYETDYAARKENPSARLYMCVGGVESGVPGYEKLVAFLKNRHYRNLEIRSDVLDNTGHSGTKGIGYEKGLQFAFERPDISLPASVLQTYVGSYEMKNGTPLRILLENGKLVAHVGNTTIELQAASPVEFYTKSFFLKIHFAKENQKVSGFQLSLYGSSEFVKKLND